MLFVAKKFVKKFNEVNIRDKKINNRVQPFFPGFHTTSFSL
jgi:hypothetical protein